MFLKQKAMNFPLYTSLSKDIPKKDLSVKQKEEFIEKISTIDEIGRDLIYVLIMFYADEYETDNNVEKLPYNGICENYKKNLSNLTWNFSDFPQDLRHILYKFLKMHIEKRQEDENLQEHRTK